MYAAANSPRGGVAPKTIRLRGQGIIEYAPIPTVVGKQAQDRTLDEQKAAGADSAKNSSSFVVYAKAEAAMKARTL